MEKKKGCRDSFLVQIRNTQNATWQGTVTWTQSRRSESFRSALELIRLINSALEEEAGETAPER